MPENRVSDQVVAWTKQAIERHAQGEDIRWDLVTAWAPQAGGLVLMWVITIPAAVLGERLQAFGAPEQARPLGLTEEHVDEFVRTMLDQLRQARTQTLAPSNGHGEVREVAPPTG